MVFDVILTYCLLIFLELCLSCGDTNIVTAHPLFEGGLCKECKVQGRPVIYPSVFFDS